MVYDKKTYDEYIKKAIEPTDIQIYRSTPFLITNTEFGYVYSKLRLDSPAEEQSFAKLTFEISFEYNDLSIKESFVHHIEFYQHSCDGRYCKHALDYGTILMPEDMDDYLLVIYKNRQDENAILQNYDISIYDSVHKICELKNVTSLRNVKKLDKNKIFYYRRLDEDNSWCSYNERWVYMNGQEYSENTLNLSLSEWNDLFCPHDNSFWDLRKIFSSKNNVSFFSKELMWNSEKKIKWECPLGHTWTASVKGLTTRTVYRNYCPVCREFVPKFALTSDEKHAKSTFDKIQRARQEYKVEDIESVITLLEEEIAEFQEMCEMGILWYNHAKMPDAVSFSFAFPNGKHGDIDKTICETYGEVSQTDEFLFRGLIPTNYYEEIELLSESYADKRLLYDIANEELTAFLLSHNVMHRLNFLSSLAHQFKMPTGRYLSIDREMTKYRSRLREKRTEIYNSVVGENKATYKWTSEQLLYHIVKSVFADAVFQYKTNWLGNQSLDIFIPSKSVGIEYQGLQHYQPVDLFGGEKQFVERKRLDERKKILCQENNVTLIEWKYNKEISDESVKATLRNWM